MEYKFDYKGGIIKDPRQQKSSKFLLFHLIPTESEFYKEQIFYQSVNGGHIVDNSKFAAADSETDRPKAQYETAYPYFKLFTLAEGFGVRRIFTSFYFKLDVYGRTCTVRPISDLTTGHYFTGKLNFLSNEDVAKLIGIETLSYKYFSNQSPIPKRILDRIVVYGVDEGKVDDLSPFTKGVRKILV